MGLKIYPGGIKVALESFRSGHSELSSCQDIPKMAKLDAKKPQELEIAKLENHEIKFFGNFFLFFFIL